MFLRLAVITAALVLTTYAQSPVPPITDIPNFIGGVGASWQRGQPHPLAMELTAAFRLKQSNFYSWSNAETPVARTKGKPQATSITSGFAWVAFHDGNVSLVVILQGGLSIMPTEATAAATAVTPSVSAGAGIDIRLGKSNAHAFLSAKTSNATSVPVASGALVTAILQPEFRIMWGR